MTGNKSTTLVLAVCGVALLALAVALRFIGTDDALRTALRDAAMSAAGTSTGRTETPPTAELLLLDESGLVLRGPTALQGTHLELDAVRDAQINGSGVAIERWPDGTSWLTAFAATRRSTANTLRIAVVRHPPDRGDGLRASVWAASAGGVLLLLAAFARRRRRPDAPAATQDESKHIDNIVQLPQRAPRDMLVSRLAPDDDELPPLLLDNVVAGASMDRAVTAAIMRTPLGQTGAVASPVNEAGEIRPVAPGAETPLFNDAPLLALQMSVPADAFVRVLQARLADAGRRVRILEVAAIAYDAATLRRESADLAEFAASFGAPALREAVELVHQVAELQLTTAYKSAVAQVDALYRATEGVITASFIANSAT